MDHNIKRLYQEAILRTERAVTMSHRAAEAIMALTIPTGFVSENYYRASQMLAVCNRILWVQAQIRKELEDAEDPTQQG